MAFTRPGAIVVDVLIGMSTGGIVWGAPALMAGFAGGILQLAERRAAPALTQQPQSARATVAIREVDAWSFKEDRCI